MYIYISIFLLLAARTERSESLQHLLLHLLGHGDARQQVRQPSAHVGEHQGANRQ